MKVEIIGTLKEVQEIMTFDSGFQKRTVVIETEDKYDNVIPVQLLKDNVTALDGVEVGTRVKVAVYLGGREWNGKYFVDLKYAELLGVQRDLNQQPPEPAPQPQNRAQPSSKPAKQTHMEVDAGKDLPF